MTPCDYVVKETNPQTANPLERCGAPATPNSRFCAKHEAAVRKDPADEARQNALRSPKKS